VVLDLASGEHTTLAEHPQGHQLGGERFSPDGRWASFVETATPTRRRIFIAPITGKMPLPPSDWIPITDGHGLDHETRWSLDGKLLYFLSERDGFRCFWAQRLDPATNFSSGWLTGFP
jgi:Tol biopolymer transport system component